MKPYIKPSEMVKPPNMLWGEYMTEAFALDRQRGHELHSNAAFMQLLDYTCARLAKAQIEEPSQRLILPRVMKIASSKVPAKAHATGFSRTRSSEEVQQAIARRLAMR